MKPLERTKQQRTQDDDISGEDSMEETEATDDGSAVSVDTDVDTEPSDAEGSDHDVFAPHADPPAADEHPERLRRPPLWSNTYFYILDNEGHPDVKARMYSVWATEKHMGHYSMSKTLTPAQFGETRSDPPRSFALLKPWVLWRGRLHGWATARPGRARQFDRDARELQQEVEALPGRLLGNDAADDKLREWAPDVVDRILAKWFLVAGGTDFPSSGSHRRPIAARLL